MQTKGLPWYNVLQAKTSDFSLNQISSHKDETSLFKGLKIQVFKDDCFELHIGAIQTPGFTWWDESFPATWEGLGANFEVYSGL